MLGSCMAHAWRVHGMACAGHVYGMCRAHVLGVHAPPPFRGGVQAQTSHFVSPLANLAYKMLFCSEAFKVLWWGGSSRDEVVPGGRPRAPCARELLPWVKQLSYFLNHFPDDHGGIEPLRRLERSLMKRVGKESTRTHQESGSFLTNLASDEF